MGGEKQQIAVTSEASDQKSFSELGEKPTANHGSKTRTH